MALGCSIIKAILILLLNASFVLSLGLVALFITKSQFFFFPLIILGIDLSYLYFYLVLGVVFVCFSLGIDVDLNCEDSEIAYLWSQAYFVLVRFYKASQDPQSSIDLAKAVAFAGDWGKEVLYDFHFIHHDIGQR